MSTHKTSLDAWIVANWDFLQMTARKYWKGGTTDAEDILQEAVMNALSHAWSIENPRAYMVAAIRNTAVKYQKKCYREVCEPKVELVVSSEPVSDLELAIVWARMRHLPETEYQVVRMRLEGATEHVVAQAMGMSPSAVNRCFRSALAQLDFKAENVSIHLMGPTRSAPSRIAIDGRNVSLAAQILNVFTRICAYAWQYPTQFLHLTSLPGGETRCHKRALRQFATAVDEITPGLWSRMVEYRGRNELRLRVSRKNIHVDPGLDRNLAQLFN